MRNPESDAKVDRIMAEEKREARVRMLMAIATVAVETIVLVTVAVPAVLVLDAVLRYLAGM